MSRQLRALSSLFLLVVSTTVLATGCGDVQPLNFSMKPEKTWEQLVAEGQALKNAGKIQAAEAAFQGAVEKCEKKYGVDDARTGTCVGYLAELYRAQQEWLKARKAYKRWMSIMDKHDATGEQVKAIRKGYREVRSKIIKYDLDPETTKKAEEKRKAREAKEKQKKGDKSKD